MPAVTPIEKSALAAEVPDPGCRERKDAPSWQEYLGDRRPGLAADQNRDYWQPLHATICVETVPVEEIV